MKHLSWFGLLTSWYSSASCLVPFFVFSHEDHQTIGCLALVFDRTFEPVNFSNAFQICVNLFLTSAVAVLSFFFTRYLAADQTASLFQEAYHPQPCQTPPFAWQFLASSILTIQQPRYSKATKMTFRCRQQHFFIRNNSTSSQDVRSGHKLSFTNDQPRREGLSHPKLTSTNHRVRHEYRNGRPPGSND